MFVFDFLYNTIGQRANNPSNKKLFLPIVLNNVDDPNSRGKLLPLKGKDWDIGVIEGEGGQTMAQNFANTKSQFDGSFSIPDPQKPNPNMSFPTITINGLENILALKNPKTKSDSKGYHTTIIFDLNHYSNFSNLSLEGQYHVKQALCSADSPDSTTCNGNNKSIVNGFGTFIAPILNPQMQADLTITANLKTRSRVPIVKIKKVRLVGKDGSRRPSLDTDNLEVDVSSDLGDHNFMKPFLLQIIRNAITSEEAQDSLFASMDTTLNQPPNLARLSEVVGKQLLGAINSMVGPMSTASIPADKPSSKVPNPADRYFFDRIKLALNNAKSEFYLPKTLVEFSKPVIEPFLIPLMNLPDLSFAGMIFTGVKVERINFTGLSNAILPYANINFITATKLKGKANLGRLQRPPTFSRRKVGKAPITGTGKFSVAKPFPFSGDFKVTLADPSFSFEMTAKGKDLNQLVMTVTAASLSLSSKSNNMKITLNIKSAFKDAINTIMNKDNIKRVILSKINEAIKGNLREVSKQLTAGSRAGIASRLDN